MSATATEPVAALERLRSEMEEIDHALVALIARRRALAGAAGALKTRAGLPIADLSREAAVLRHAATNARLAGIDEEAMREIFWCVIDLCRRAQIEERAP